MQALQSALYQVRRLLIALVRINHRTAVGWRGRVATAHALEETFPATARLPAHRVLLARQERVARRGHSVLRGSVVLGTENIRALEAHLRHFFLDALFLGGPLLIQLLPFQAGVGLIAPAGLFLADPDLPLGHARHALLVGDASVDVLNLSRILSGGQGVVGPTEVKVSSLDSNLIAGDS